MFDYVPAYIYSYICITAIQHTAILVGNIQGFANFPPFVFVPTGDELGELFKIWREFCVIAYRKFLF